MLPLHRTGRGRFDRRTASHRPPVPAPRLSSECASEALVVDDQDDSPETRSLNLLDAAGISPPAPFDGAGMWRELQMLFRWERMDREFSKATKKADEGAIDKVLGAARSEEHTSELQSRQSRMPSSA